MSYLPASPRERTAQHDRCITQINCAVPAARMSAQIAGAMRFGTRQLDYGPVIAPILRHVLEAQSRQKRNMMFSER